MQAAADISQLKGIMPSVEIDTGALPYLCISIALLILLIVTLWWYARHRKKRPSTPQSQALHRLKALDLQTALSQKTRSQETLYQFSIDVHCYLDGRKDTLFDEIQEALLPYKYQADAPLPGTAMIQKIDDFIKGLT